MTQELNPNVPASLHYQPYGVQVFTDLARNKELVTLSYRKRDSSTSIALEFPARVLGDLAAAGVSLRDKVTITLSPAKAGHRFDCYAEVPIKTEQPENG